MEVYPFCHGLLQESSRSCWRGAAGAEWGQSPELAQLANLCSSASSGGRVSEMDICKALVFRNGSESRDLKVMVAR